MNQNSLRTINVQVNGEVFVKHCFIDDTMSKEEILAKAKRLAMPKTQGKKIVKEIFVPDRLVNLVTEKNEEV